RDCHHSEILPYGHNYVICAGDNLMRIVLLTAMATLLVGCGSISEALFGGYSGQMSSQGDSFIAPGATFAVVPAPGVGQASNDVKASVTEGMEQLGFVAADNPASADIIAQYEFSVSAPKVRFRNLSNGFNRTNEMYTQKTYLKNFSLTLSDTESNLIWEGELSSEDGNQVTEKLADIYVGQLLSHYGETVDDQDWFVPRFAADRMLTKTK
ncbi:MAG: hypothetical protein ACR2QG_11650, partial [Gammaproteobacteria bacterium]